MTSRIQIILKSMNLSPSQLADEIDVQRSSVSHILSGRNKPSLDFVMKILTSYPEIRSDWLLFGKGSMISKLVNTPSEKISPENIQEKKEIAKTILQAEEKQKGNEDPNSGSMMNSEESTFHETGIEKIIFFFQNNTYKVYKPSK